MYIYKTTNLINNKIYIGKCQRTVLASNDYLGSGKLLKASIAKYGKNNFCKEILENCASLQELNDKEIYWISYYKSCNKQHGYNITSGGSGGDTLTNNPNIYSIKQNCSEGQKNRWTKLSLKERATIIETKIGVGNPFYGKKHTDETKNKLSQSKKGIPNSKETNKKIKLTLLHKYANKEIIKTISEKMKQKISLANKGRKHTKEALLKISTALTGENNPSAKNWEFKNLEGDIFIVKGTFQQFCKNYNLSIKIMRNIADNKRKNLYYNNWTVRRYDEGIKE